MASEGGLPTGHFGLHGVCSLCRVCKGRASRTVSRTRTRSMAAAGAAPVEALGRVRGALQALYSPDPAAVAVRGEADAFLQVCVRACVCVCACIRACVHACVWSTRLLQGSACVRARARTADALQAPAPRDRASSRPPPPARTACKHPLHTREAGSLGQAPPSFTHTLLPRVLAVPLPPPSYARLPAPPGK